MGSDLIHIINIWFKSIACKGQRQNKEGKVNKIKEEETPEREA